MSDIPWRNPNKPFTRHFPTATKPPPKWTQEQLESWRNNLRRMGLHVTDKTMPFGQTQEDK